MAEESRSEDSEDLVRGPCEGEREAACCRRLLQKEREGKRREEKGREGKGREGREGKGREGKGREGKGREGKRKLDLILWDEKGGR